MHTSNQQAKSLQQANKTPTPHYFKYTLLARAISSLPVIMGDPNYLKSCPPYFLSTKPAKLSTHSLRIKNTIS